MYISNLFRDSVYVNYNMIHFFKFDVKLLLSYCKKDVIINST